METKTVKVPNVGCNGCVNSIRGEVSEIPGVVAVSGDPATKLITIQWDAPADWDAIRAAMTAIDYAPENA
jgi:copper chaperone CopZ